MEKQVYLDINPEAIEMLATLPDDQPLYMLNYLKYNDVVEKDITGRDMYKIYMNAAMPFFAKVNAEIVFKTRPNAMVIGDVKEELWDELLLVRYASKKDFLGMLSMEGYPSHLRKKALKDSRLIFCK